MRPDLSVVIVIANDTVEPASVEDLRGCLEALANQQNAAPAEIIVPHYSGIAGLRDLSREFPETVFLEVADLRTRAAPGRCRDHHDELRSRGIARAQGRIVALLEDHDRPAPDWCARVAAEHAQAWEAIGGAVENAVDRPLNWAVYFCDFGKYQNPLPAGESDGATDVNVSYKRAALDAIAPVWRTVFNETVVHAELRRRGGRIALSPDIVVYQQRERLRLLPALKERYVWGRSYAATRAALEHPAMRAVRAALCPALPLVLLARMARHAFEKRRTRAAFLKALPWTALLAVAWSAGEFAGYLTARACAGAASAARTAGWQAAG